VHTVKKQLSKYSLCWLVFGSTAILLLLAGVPAVGQSQASPTLANLQTAYNGETNAHARYLAFAEKADQEGYGELASLFRAAARAEQVHLTNHAAVICEMGAEPVAAIEKPVIMSTRQNLENVASKGEAYERDTMYPAFIRQANADGNRDAVRTFDSARKAEAQHFRLFRAALANLENMRGSQHTYYVCTVCGYTVSEPVTAACVSCGSPADYEMVT
jgi:rubrerythrin